MQARYKASVNVQCDIPAYSFDDRPAAPRDSAGRDTYFIGCSLFRISLGIYLLVDFLVIGLPFYASLYTDAGVYPRWLLMSEYPHLTAKLSLLAMNDYWLFHVLFVAAYITSLIALTLGWRTRLSTLLALVGFVSLDSRNLLIISGADQLTRLLLVWSLFLPLGRFFSVDAALSPERRDAPYPRLPFMAIKIQIAVIYLMSAINKLAGNSWLEGGAVRRSLVNNMFSGQELSRWLVEHASFLLVPLTFGVLVFQFSFSLLIYSPWRRDLMRAIAIAGAFLMHFAFIFLLNVGTFPYICMAYLLLLAPDRWWHRLFAKRRARLSPVRIYYEPDCGFCLKIVRLLREFSLPAATPIRPASDDPEALALLRAHNSWVVYDHRGKARLKWDGVAYVLKRSPAFAWLGRLTDMEVLKPRMEKLYRRIGDNRPKLGEISARILPVRAERIPGRIQQGFCLFLLILMLLYNALSIPKPAFPQPWAKQAVGAFHIDMPKWFANLVSFMQVAQTWDLFAPNPEMLIRRFSITGIYENNQVIDVQERLPFRLVDIAANGYQLSFINHRWLKYFSNISKHGNNRRDALGRYICRHANSEENRFLPRVKTVVISQALETRKENIIGPPVQNRVFTRSVSCLSEPPYSTKAKK